MRLICPNCDAQYEVPEGVMPPEGRDVQCSNCGETWFQEHPDHLTFTDEDDDKAGTAGIEQEAEDKLPQEPPSPSKSQVKPEEEAPSRRKIDPQVADILREEADFEAAARRKGKAAPLESQEELGLDGDGMPTDRLHRAQEERAKGNISEENTSGTATTDVSSAQSRRDLLPDIEEINSTLRSSSERIASGDPTEIAAANARETKSSRRGFTLTIVLAVFLTLIYLFAQPLAEAVPQLDPWINSYVGTIDSWRMWLDQQVSDLLNWLESTARAKGAADAAAGN